VTTLLWVATVLGALGVAAGLLAVSRGARPKPRFLVGAALVVAAAFTVLPAAGSSDVLDYAAYGRMVTIGHSPYQMTPLQLRETGDPVGMAAPTAWEQVHSDYGPLATVEQAVAAKLGGPSAARIVFWLRLWNTLAFAVVVLTLDRMLRSHPGRRVRAHLLWSLNPLLLWDLVAAGHLDTIATALALLAILATAPPQLWPTWIRDLLTGRQLRSRPFLVAETGTTTGRPGGKRWSPPASRPGMLQAAIAGVFVGAATDVKITYAIAGLAVAWAVRGSWRTLLAAAAGALAVLAPSYLWFGKPALTVLFNHRAATNDTWYRLFSASLLHPGLPQLALLIGPLMIIVAGALLWRLPDGFPAVPAVKLTLALGVAWMLTWPYQRPWYDALVLCLLALYPASRLDWPVLLQLAATTFFYMPGMPGRAPQGWQRAVHDFQLYLAMPAIRLGVLVAVLVLCATGAWYSRRSAQWQGAPLLA
jgi:hypothetical protein